MYTGNIGLNIQSPPPPSQKQSKNKKQNQNKAKTQKQGVNRGAHDGLSIHISYVSHCEVGYKSCLIEERNKSTSKGTIGI